MASFPGIANLYTRVERWECDFNDHWNTRHHVGCVQAAAEVVAMRAGLANAGAAFCDQRHLRFHRELFAGASVTVFSARVAGGAFDGAVLHLMTSEGQLCTSALDRPGQGGEALPTVVPEEIARALPRGLTSAPPAAPDSAEPLELGPLRPKDFDHAGQLLAESLVSRSASASTALWQQLVGDPVPGIGRMAVESRFSHLGDCQPGDRLLATSRLIHLGTKSLTLCHWIATGTGAPVARVEHVLLTVDLQSRRAIALPGALRRAVARDSVTL